MPRVSIVIPAFNGAAFLAEALESVLAQSLPPSEILVVDDCSTDDTVAIVECFAARGVNVERSATRRGLSGNWNHCVERATGEYVCVFHQDDVMHPENIARKSAILDQNPRMPFVCSAAEEIDADGRIIPDSQPRDNRLRSTREFTSAEFLEKLLEKNFIRASSVIARREALKAAGRFRDLTYLPDWEMWLRLADQGSVGWIAEPLVSARWHPGSETHQQRRDDADMHEYARLLPELIERYAPRTSDCARVTKRAWSSFASGCMNRAYHALKYDRDPERARAWLKRAVSASPGSLGALVRDPRWALLAALLYVAPGVANRVCRHPD